MRRIVKIFSALLVVIAIAGFFILRGDSGNEKVLPDGSFIHIEKVAFAKQEHFQLGGRLQLFKKAVADFWRTHVSRTAPPSRIAGTSSWWMNAVVHSNEPALYIYISRREPGKGYVDVHAQTAELIDDDGCFFFSTQSGGWDDAMITTPPARGMNYSVGWFRFEAFPRRQKKFRFVVHEDMWPTPAAHPGQAEFLIANPAPPPTNANWSVEPLPITRTQDAVSFTLTNVKIDAQTRGGLPYANNIDAEYKSMEDGQPSTNWQAVLSELYDGSGNVTAKQNSWDACLSLCPREAAWKLKVKFFGAEKSRAALNAVWTIRGLKVPGEGESVRIGQTNVLQGVLITVGAFGGVGDFTYSNSIVLKTGPPKKMEPNHAMVVAWPANSNGKGTIKPTFTLNTKSPHLAIDLGDLNDDQRFTARMIDEQGREYYGQKVNYYYPSGHDRQPDAANYLSNWYESEGSFVLFDLPADVKTVDLFLCVHTCRTAEFIFKPPQPKVASAK